MTASFVPSAAHVHWLAFREDSHETSRSGVRALAAFTAAGSPVSTRLKINLAECL